MKYAVEINKVSKCFELTGRGHTLFSFFKKNRIQKKAPKSIWALKDINLNIKPGETIGIIGNNAAGKTTLLRIIAGIYKPSKGSLLINGKISGFLYLGMGMQRELSALENIYLYGAIIGMSKNYIDKQLDDIISFAELENFIHTPMKDFSSGMIVRLFFSVARQIDSDILFFDEILFGGDIHFRDKIVEVFKQYKETGKTIIISSHSMDIIEMFCDRALLLNCGNQLAFGNTKDVINTYNKS